VIQKHGDKPLVKMVLLLKLGEPLVILVKQLGILREPPLGERFWPEAPELIRAVDGMIEDGHRYP